MTGADNPGTSAFWVVPEHVSDAGRYIQQTADALVAGIRTVDLEMLDLRTTWTGDAARKYLEGWEDTREGALKVLQALSVMAESLGVTVKTVVNTDRSTSTGFGSLNL